MVMNRTVCITFVFLLLASLAGCKKNKKEIDLRPDLNVANDLVLSNRPFVYVFTLLVKAASDSLLQATHHAVIDGASVNLDAENRKYTFYFFRTLGSDSTIRDGAIAASVDSGFFNKGTRISIDFQAYCEDTRQVTGSDSIVCTGLLNGQFLYDNVITGAEILKDTVRKILFDAEYKIAVDVDVVAQGAIQTAIRFGGNSRGTSSLGYSFTSETTRDLTVYTLCPWIVDGIMAFSVPAAEIEAGTIEFMAKTLCNDKMDYDFAGNIYHMRINGKYLKY
jgi:hypothetical protein